MSSHSQPLRATRQEVKSVLYRFCLVSRWCLGPLTSDQECGAQRPKFHCCGVKVISYVLVITKHNTEMMAPVDRLNMWNLYVIVEII